MAKDSTNLMDEEAELDSEDESAEEDTKKKPTDSYQVKSKDGLSIFVNCKQESV